MCTNSWLAAKTLIRFLKKKNLFNGKKLQFTTYLSGKLKALGRLSRRGVHVFGKSLPDS